jgi:hypothetical protein
VDDRDVDRKEAAEAGAERDDDEGGIEAAKRIDLAEEDEAEPERDDADANHSSRAEPVDDPSERRSEQRRLHRLHRGGAGERCLAPAAFGDQCSEVGAERLVEQRRLHELETAACGNHPPAVEDLAPQKPSPLVDVTALTIQRRCVADAWPPMCRRPALCHIRCPADGPVSCSFRRSA